MARRTLLLPQAVTLTVSCRTSRELGAPARRHPVTLNPDGTVETRTTWTRNGFWPHWAATSRAWVGGHCGTCVLRLVPRPGAWVPRPIRAKQPAGAMAGGQIGRHAVPHAVSTSPKKPPNTPAAPAHRQSGRDPPRVLGQLVQDVTVPPPAEAGDQPWATLWECGMHPDRVELVDQTIGALSPMPVSFYLGVMSTNPVSPGWPTRSGTSTRTLDTAIWLAWTYCAADRKDPAARTGWLATGVLRRLILPLMASVYTVADVEAFANHWNMSLSGAAVELHTWVEAGSARRSLNLTGPRTSHLGFPRAPGFVARYRLRNELRQTPVSLTDADLAMALVEHGDVLRAREHWPMMRFTRLLRPHVMADWFRASPSFVPRVWNRSVRDRPGRTVCGSRTAGESKSG